MTAKEKRIRQKAWNRYLAQRYARLAEIGLGIETPPPPRGSPVSERLRDLLGAGRQSRITADSNPVVIIQPDGSALVGCWLEVQPDELTRSMWQHGADCSKDCPEGCTLGLGGE